MSGGYRRKGVVELSQCSESVRVFQKVFIHNAHVIDTNMPELKGNTYLINILLNGGKIYPRFFSVPL